MDYAELLKPYAPNRDDLAESLRLGLLKEYSPEIVDNGMSVVLARMERGKKFDDVRHVNRALRRACHAQAVARERAAIRLAQANAGKIIEASGQHARWRDVIPWAILGGFVGAGLMWMMVQHGC